ncbi:MAG TPA: hypothetical protein VFQ09_02765 [Rubrobacter sp.]|nr:hypothetical protein [Rubrobacter sp.]
MTLPLPPHELIELLGTGPSSDSRKARSGSGASTSLRVPGALSGPLAGASFIAGVAGAGALSGSPYPRPGAQPADVRRYFRGSPGAGRVSVVGQLVSAASLARFTASVAKLAGRSGRGSRGLRTAAVGGGVLAATSLATSALCAAALTGSRGEQDASAALHRLMFAAGGPVHGAGFGVLIGTLGLAGLRTGELPRPLAIAGLVSATAGLLSPLYFVTDRAVWFIPGGRFSGLLISGIAGVLLSRRLRTS